jgi:hypothetical protein
MPHYIRYIFLSLAFAPCTLCIAGSHPQLPPSAEKALVQRFLGNKGKVAYIEYIRQRHIASFDYLGVQATFEVTDNFESLYHPLVVLRKRQTDSDWLQADFFSCGSNHIPQLFVMSESDFLKALVPSHIK